MKGRHLLFFTVLALSAILSVSATASRSGYASSSALAPQAKRVKLVVALRQPDGKAIDNATIYVWRYEELVDINNWSPGSKTPTVFKSGSDGSASTELTLEPNISSLVVKVVKEDFFDKVDMVPVRSPFPNEIPRTITLSPKKLETAVPLVVTVISKGKPVPNARVNVWRLTTRSDEILGRDRTPDIQMDTNQEGVASTNVMTWKNFFNGQPEIDLDIRVVKTDYEAKGDRITLKNNIPAEITRTIIIFPTNADLAEVDAMNLIIKVMRASDKAYGPVGGAQVDVYINGYKANLQSNRKHFSGQTNNEGIANVRVQAFTDYEVKVTKSGFRERSTTVTLPTYQQRKLPKESGPYLVQLEEFGGAELNFTVRDGETGERLIETDILVDAVLEGTQNLPSDTLIRYRTSTNSEGQAKLFINGLTASAPKSGQSLGRFTVKLSKRFYETQQDEITLTHGEGSKELSYDLKPDGTKEDGGQDSVIVTVLAGDRTLGGKPMALRGATAWIGGKGISTDQDGQVTLKGYFDDAVQVKATAQGYKSASKMVSIRKSTIRSKGGTGRVSFVLEEGEDERSEDTAIKLIVEVHDSVNNKLLPGVDVGFLTSDGTFLYGGQTNAKGERDFNSEESPSTQPLSALRAGMKLELKLKGYSPKEGVLISSDLLKPSAEVRRFSVSLEPLAAANLPIDLTVEVRSAGKNEGLAGAAVKLVYAGKVVQSLPTQPNGTATFHIVDSPSFPVDRLRSGLSAEVSAANYKAKTTEIPGTLLKASTDQQTFTVAIERDWTALITAVDALEGKVGAWNNDIREAAAKAESARTSANQIKLAAERAKAIVNNLHGLSGPATGVFGPGMSSRCEKIETLRRALLGYEVEARQKDADLRQRLSQANSLSASCKSAADGERIKSNHQAAIRLVAEIGVIEKRAVRDANATDFDKEVKALEGTFKDAEDQVRRIEIEVSTAETLAAKARADFNRSAQLGPSATFRRDVLNAELQNIRTNFEVAKFSTEIPTATRAKLDQIEGVLRGAPAIAAPDADALAAAISGAESVKNSLTEAQRIVSGFKSVSCDTAPLKEVVERLGTVLTNASFELGLAADLPTKANACANTGACGTWLAEVRPLLEQGDIKTAQAQIAYAAAQGCDVSKYADEVDYYRTLAEAANTIRQSQLNCRFSQAISLARQMPPAMKEKAPLAQAIAEAENGLKAQQRIGPLLGSAKDFADKRLRSTAMSFISEAEEAAGTTPCLIDQINQFKTRNKLGEEAIADNQTPVEDPGDDDSSDTAKKTGRRPSNRDDDDDSSPNQGSKRSNVVEEPPDDDDSTPSRNRKKSGSSAVEEPPDDDDSIPSGNRKKSGSSAVEEPPDDQTGTKPSRGRAGSGNTASKKPARQPARHSTPSDTPTPVGNEKVIDMTGTWIVTERGASVVTWSLPLTRTGAKEWKGTPVVISASSDFYTPGVAGDEITVQVTAPGHFKALVTIFNDYRVWYEGTYDSSRFTIRSAKTSYTGIRQ